MQSSIAQKLAMMQLADSFFPTGTFTFSHGLEALVQSEQVQTQAELLIFLELLLSRKIGTTDLVALLHSYRGSKQEDMAAVEQADHRLYVQTAIAKHRATQRQSGRALLMVASSTWQDRRLEILNRLTAAAKIHCLQPIIFGAIAAVVNITEEDTAIAFLHGFATGILGAAIRLGVLGHLQAQRLLLELAPAIERTYLAASTMSLERMWSGIPTLEIAQMQHAQLNQRLFAN